MTSSNGTLGAPGTHGSGKAVLYDARIGGASPCRAEPSFGLETMRRAIGLTLVALALSRGAAAQWQLEMTTTGESAVPAVTTTALGHGAVTIDEHTHLASYILVVSGLQATAASIRVGAPGENGPLVIPMSGGPGVFEGTAGPLTPEQISTLLKDGMYAVVESASHPGGELRGQIELVKRSYFKAVLNGQEPVPPSGSPATGVAWVRICETDHIWAYDLKTTGINDATAARVRIGASGTNGAVLFDLTGGNGHWCGVSPFFSEAETLACHQGELYLEVDSLSHPDGAIRGKLVPTTALFSITLDAAQHVPPTSSTATGDGWFEYDPNTEMVTYQFSVTGLSGLPTATYVRSGIVGEEGPIVAQITGGPTTWMGTLGPVPPGKANALYRGLRYVEIRTAAFPLGEIRGQIRPNPYIFGGAHGSNGVVKASAHGYGPSTGNVLTLSLQNVIPDTSSFLFVSTSSTFSSLLAAPLPIVIFPLGTLYTDASQSFMLELPNGASGCPEITFAVPPIPVLGGLRGYAQWATIDPINVFSIVLSDAVEFRLLP